MSKQIVAKRQPNQAQKVVGNSKESNAVFVTLKLCRSEQTNVAYY